MYSQNYRIIYRLSVTNVLYMFNNFVHLCYNKKKIHTRKFILLFLIIVITNNNTRPTSVSTRLEKSMILVFRYSIIFNNCYY